jgi:hypothetical protein
MNEITRPLFPGGGRVPLAAALLGGTIAFLATSVAGWLDGLQPAQLFLRAGLAGLALAGLSLVLGKLGMQVVLEPARPARAKGAGGAAAAPTALPPAGASQKVEAPVGPRPAAAAGAGGPGATGPPGRAGPPSRTGRIR